MKRSERFLKNSIHETAIALALIGAASASAIWAVVAAQAGSMPGGFALLLAAATALFLGALRLREGQRLIRMHEMEKRAEWLRSVRPKFDRDCLTGTNGKPML